MQKKINPIGFKNVTLYLDGHDSRINYNEKDIKKRNFYSYKFKNSGLRTQVIYDINEFAIYISKSKPCKNYNDGQMFLNMKLENKFNENDCIVFDGGYYYYIEKFKENCENKGNDKVNRNNFMFPIRKAKNIDSKDEEILYNETLGSFRSKIESCFGLLGNKFKRFNNNESSVKVTDIKIYNLQLKLSILLLSINKFCKYYNIEIKPNHILWINDNFDYPNPYRNNSINNVIYQFDLMRITHMTNQQDEFISNYYEYNIKNNSNMEIESNSGLDEDSFEVEKIIKHRKFKKRMKFYVKWKDYDEIFNDWVWQEDFNDVTIIDEYLAAIKNK